MDEVTTRLLKIQLALVIRSSSQWAMHKNSLGQAMLITSMLKFTATWVEAVLKPHVLVGELKTDLGEYRVIILDGGSLYGIEG